MEKQAVAGTAHVEGHALVALIGLARESVAIDDVDLLPALIHGGAFVAKSIDAFTTLQLDARDTLAGVNVPAVDQDLVAAAQLQRKDLILQGQIQDGRGGVERHFIRLRVDPHVDGRVGLIRFGGHIFRKSRGVGLQREDAHAERRR